MLNKASTTQNKDWNGKARNVVIQWITEEGNIMKATVSFSQTHTLRMVFLFCKQLPQKALGLLQATTDLSLCASHLLLRRNTVRLYDR